MQWLRMLISRLKGSARQGETQSELSAELHSHLEMLVDENTQRGMDTEEARRQAMLTLGNHGQIQEAYHRQAGVPFLEVLLQDTRYAWRMLRRYPGFAAVAVITLALGIGANSAIFSIVNGVLLRPLPYAQPGRLVAVFNNSSSVGNFGASPPDFRTLRDRNRTLAGLSAWYGSALNLSGGTQPERLSALVVSPDYFTTLGAEPVVGRKFMAGEDQWGAHRVAIVSNAFWRTRLNADRNITAHTLTLNGELYTVIGVMPADFYVQTPAELWLPMAWKPGDNSDSHNNYFVSMVGRLRPGVTQAQALADLNSLMLGIAQQFPENRGIGSALKPLCEDWLGNVRPALLILMGAVACVLLIACVNLANLLLARSAGRQKEIAIRSALGAGRRRLLRQFMTESILLACIGGALGLLLAWLALRLLPLAGNLLPRMQQVRLDGQVLLFTLATSMLTGLLFGLLPALQNSRTRGIGDTLKEGGRSSAGAGSERFRAALVVCEVSLALVLLIGSGLAIKSFTRLMRVNAGFNPDRVLTFAVNLPDSYDPQPDPLRRGAPPRVAGFFQELLSRIERIPGVKAAGYVSSLPLQGERWGKLFVPLDRPVAASIDKLDDIQYRAVLGHYFDALQIRLVKGRLIDEHDQATSPYVVMINETMGRRYWPGADPIGKPLLLSPPENLLPPGLAPPGYHPQRFTIAGVVADVHYGSVDRDPIPLAYASILQHDFAFSPCIAVRSEGDPRMLISSIRDLLRQLDKDVPMARVMTMDEIMSSSVAQPRLQAALLGLFGGLALALAAIGIYGVMAYSVSRRTNEIGIRMALGASRLAVLRMVLGRGLGLTGVGLGIGIALAFGLTRLMSNMLFGVSPTDPGTFVAILFLLAASAGLACYLPARRATRVDPVVALRYE